MKTALGFSAVFIFLSIAGCDRSDERREEENSVVTQNVSSGKTSENGPPQREDLDCANLTKAARAEQKRIAHCQRDEDCARATGPLWYQGPVYCGAYHNGSESLEKLRGITERFRAADCPAVRVDCAGSAGNVRCIEGRCSASSTSNPAGKNVDCGAIRDAMIAEADRVNHCQQDSDCTYLGVPGNVMCPRGCWMYYSRFEDLSSFHQLVKAHEASLCGVRCRSRCAREPEGMICAGGKCAPRPRQTP